MKNEEDQRSQKIENENKKHWRQKTYKMKMRPIQKKFEDWILRSQDLVNGQYEGSTPTYVV